MSAEKGIAVHRIPIALGILFPVTFCISYAWSVLSGHVPAYFPYISDTGAFAPESCFFGEMLNLGAILIASFVIIRYYQLRDFVQLQNFPHLCRLAQIGVGFGLASAFGITLVANFQEPNLLQMHAAGAFLVFGLGAAYLWIEVIITFQISNGTASARRIIRIRTVLAVINSSSFGVTIIALKIALDRYITNSQRVRQNWWPEDGGHDVHVVSAFAEWIVALTQMLFFTTYSCEFRKYKVTFPKLVHRQIATTIPDTIRYRSIIQPEKKLLDTAPSLGVLPAERPSILDVRA